MIHTVTGDLLEAKEDMIAHQVNCFGVAGGLAAAVFERYPDAKNDYFQVIDRLMEGDRTISLLGTAQFTGQQADGKIIVNLFGQYYPGPDYRPAYLRDALRTLGNVARALGKTVALPHHLSCGICGGDWDEVLRIIAEELEGVEVTLYQLEEA